MIIGSLDTLLLDKKEFLANGTVIGLRLVRNTDDAGAPSVDKFGKHWFIVQDLTPETREIERNLPRDQRRPILGNAKNISGARHDAPWITVKLLPSEITKAWIESRKSTKTGKAQAYLGFSLRPATDKEREADPLTDYVAYQDQGEARRLAGVKTNRIGLGVRGQRREESEGPAPGSAPENGAPVDPADQWEDDRDLPF